jgi:hypothetical protein
MSIIPTSNVFIEYNNVSHTAWSGIQKGYSGSNIYINYNVVTDCGKAPNNAIPAGICVASATMKKGLGGSVIYLSDNDNINVGYNTVLNCTIGIYAYPRNDYSIMTNLNIYKNTVNLTSDNGIRLRFTEPTSQLIAPRITENSVYNTASNAIAVFGNVTNPEISRNEIGKSTQAGITLGTGSVTNPISGSLIAENRIIGCLRGVTVVYSMNTTLRNNHIMNITDVAMRVFATSNPVYVVGGEIINCAIGLDFYTDGNVIDGVYIANTNWGIAFPNDDTYVNSTVINCKIFDATTPILRQPEGVTNIFKNNILNGVWTP